jgi:hypothetical protein
MLQLFLEYFGFKNFGDPDPHESTLVELSLFRKRRKKTFKIKLIVYTGKPDQIQILIDPHDSWFRKPDLDPH